MQKVRQAYREFLLLLLSFYAFNIGNAQPTYPPPSGVWCSCPPSKGMGSGSVHPAVASKSYVNGILVRVVWKDLEPSDDVYNWSLIDDQIAAAQSYDKKISLGVGGGPNSPTWLYDLGADTLSYDFPFSGTIPIPWDTVFLTQWTALIAEIGNRYQNDTTIQLVYITNTSGNGFEMQLPFNPTPTYASIGYTDQKVIDSWKYVIDTFNTYFPNHYLTNDFHPVNSSNIVADSVYAYATSEIGPRYGASGWWWTQHNTTVYPAQYSILQNSASNNLFTGIQMAASGVTNPTTFGTGGMPEALNLAIANNVCYWEIWNQDITDGMFDDLLSQASCSTVRTAEIVKDEKGLIVFPNPSKGVFRISSKHNKLQTIELADGVGKVLFYQDGINAHQFQLDISNQKNGLYFLRIKDDSKETFYRKIMLIN